MSDEPGQDINALDIVHGQPTRVYPVDLMADSRNADIAGERQRPYPRCTQGPGQCFVQSVVFIRRPDDTGQGALLVRRSGKRSSNGRFGLLELPNSCP